MYDFDEMNELSQDLEQVVDESEFEDLSAEELDELIADAMVGVDDDADDDEDYEDEYEDDYDGQPSELTEWMDFDPDC